MSAKIINLAEYKLKKEFICPECGCAKINSGKDHYPNCSKYFIGLDAWKDYPGPGGFSPGQK